MIEIELPDKDIHQPHWHTNKSYWFEHYRSDIIVGDTRPHLNIGDSYACIVYFRKEIDDWLKDNKIYYHFDYRYNLLNHIVCIVNFKNKSDAMLFKLRWI